MKIGARVLGLWLDTYFGRHITSSGPNVVSRPQAPWLRQLLRFHDFIGFISSFSQENEVMFVKIGASVLELWLGRSGPNVLSRSQAPSSIIFLKFHNFIGFISSFLRKWGLVCENSSKDSGLMAGYFFWVQVAQINVWFLGSRS